MTAPILYCGDTNLDGAASYLAGLMTHFGWTFDYIPSDRNITSSQLETRRSLIILSDYPASQFDLELQRIALSQVEAGTGLLMIGGWESFHGFGGNWDGTPLGDALPIVVGSEDDRVNFDQPTLLHPTDWSPQPWNLPWGDRPPAIGGLNQVYAKPDATVLLTATSFRPRYVNADDVDWSNVAGSYPALVTGACGQGKTAAFMSDVAPHWVGGFVDWGPSRVATQAPNAAAVEVGSDYALFWKHLLSSVGNL